MHVSWWKEALVNGDVDERIVSVNGDIDGDHKEIDGVMDGQIRRPMPSLISRNGR